MIKPHCEIVGSSDVDAETMKSTTGATCLSKLGSAAVEIESECFGSSEDAQNHRHHLPGA